MDLEDVVEELYGLTPDRFTERRDARAVAARADGDRELAAAIKRLRRPTTSAWLANVLARRRAAELGRLLDLGAALQEAQAHLAADELRRLSQQRHQVVSALGREARQLAAEAGQKVTEPVERELTGTLEAALADPAAADAVRSGRLTTALSYSGFGVTDLEGALAVPAGRSTRPTRGRGRAGGAAGAGAGEDPGAGARRAEEHRAAEEEMGQARAAAGEAGRRLKAEDQHLDRARRDRNRAAAERADLERRLDAARAAEARAAAAVEEAERARDDAERAAGETERRVTAAQQALDRL